MGESRSASELQGECAAPEKKGRRRQKKNKEGDKAEGNSPSVIIELFQTLLTNIRKLIIFKIIHHIHNQTSNRRSLTVLTQITIHYLAPTS